MADEDIMMVQLATRVPKALHRRLKLYCVGKGVSVMDFVIEALGDRLDREDKATSARRRKAS